MGKIRVSLGNVKVVGDKMEGEGGGGSTGENDVYKGSYNKIRK